MTEARQSSIERLRELPAVVTAPWLRRQMQWDARTASVYLNRWKDKGWVALAGPRLGVYYNLLREPKITGTMRIQALRHAYPTACLMGESVLHAQGWSTQIPQALSVAVRSRPTLAHIDGVVLHARPPRWFAKVHAWCEHQGVAMPTTYDLPSLPPALALADLYGDAKAWHPDPDDLDVPREDEAVVVQALAALNVPMPPDLQEAWGLAVAPIASRRPKML